MFNYIIFIQQYRNYIFMNYGRLNVFSAKIKNIDNMLRFYNIGIAVFEKLLWLTSLFNHKALLLLDGRKMQQEIWKEKPIWTEKTIWFHFASLGEFEQGRPILEKIKKEYPSDKIVITFFSPSGFEVRKDTSLADLVLYLPADTAANAEHFIKFINPKVVFFVKYEYWYYFFKQLKQNHIPLYIISGIFRPKQIFFKWYGSLHRQILQCVSHFFVQNEMSATLLKKLDFINVSVTGDTRFDRVYAQAKQPLAFTAISSFKNNHRLLIAGSSWEKDEKLLLTLIEREKNWKFIIAPHDTDCKRIKNVSEILKNKAILFSKLPSVSQETLQNSQVLIIDKIGYLSSIYQYGDIAYIGGGFNKGIHNCLEAAAFGLPILFGPKYDKFQEAHDLITIGSAKSVSDIKNLLDAFDYFKLNICNNDAIKNKTIAYIKNNVNATNQIFEKIFNNQ